MKIEIPDFMPLDLTGRQFEALMQMCHEYPHRELALLLMFAREVRPKFSLTDLLACNIGKGDWTIDDFLQSKQKYHKEEWQY